MLGLRSTRTAIPPLNCWGMDQGKSALSGKRQVGRLVGPLHGLGLGPGWSVKVKREALRAERSHNGAYLLLNPAALRGLSGRVECWHPWHSPR